jgi:hypothetical protein
MPEYARVVTFEADAAAIDAVVAEINSVDGPPEDVPATRIIVLADRANGKMMIGTRFASEEDMQRGSAALEAMSPPDVGTMRRVSVDHYEVLLERQA